MASLAGEVKEKAYILEETCAAGSGEMVKCVLVRRRGQFVSEKRHRQRPSVVFEAGVSFVRT